MEMNKPKTRSNKEVAYDTAEMALDIAIILDPNATKRSVDSRYKYEPKFHKMINYLAEILYMIQTDDVTDKGRHTRFRIMKEAVKGIEDLNGSDGLGEIRAD